MPRRLLCSCFLLFLIRPRGSPCAREPLKLPVNDKYNTGDAMYSKSHQGIGVRGKATHRRLRASPGRCWCVVVTSPAFFPVVGQIFFASEWVG
eukprot:scaffold2433_cov159-Amphora_coffeaeformis.AAC.11